MLNDITVSDRDIDSFFFSRKKRPLGDTSTTNTTIENGVAQKDAASASSSDPPLAVVSHDADNENGVAQNDASSSWLDPPLAVVSLDANDRIDITLQLWGVLAAVAFAISWVYLH